MLLCNASVKWDHGYAVYSEEKCTSKNNVTKVTLRNTDLVILFFFFFQDGLSLAINVILNPRIMKDDPEHLESITLGSVTLNTLLLMPKDNHFRQGGARYTAMFVLFEIPLSTTACYFRQIRSNAAISSLRPHLLLCFCLFLHACEGEHCMLGSTMASK